MNCKEFKNLVSELTGLNEISINAELSAHLQGCEDCRRFISYEEKLRDGFAEIAAVPMPADIARKILAIPQTACLSGSLPENKPDALKWLRGLVNSFSFRLALASGVTGFFLGILLIRENSRELSNSIKENFAKSEKTEMSNKPLLNFAPPLQQNESDSVIQDTEDTVTLGQQLQKLARANKAKSEDSRLPETFKKRATLQADKLNSSEKSEEQNTPQETIAGAFSFALEKSDLPESGEAVNLIDTDSSAEATFAAAPAKIPTGKGLKMAMAPSAPSMRADSFPESSKSLHSEENRQKTEFESPPSDPRAGEILSFLQNNGLAKKEGFIDLEQLVMRGFISNQQLRAWQPTDGNSWYLNMSGGKNWLNLRRKP